MDKILNWLNQMLRVCYYECRSVVKDSGVLIIIVGGSLLYPLLYCSIYQNESIYEVPVVVVDESNTMASRELLRKIDAAPEVSLTTHATTMAEAQEIFESRKVHGIVYIPADFSEKLARLEQAHISVYSDMSSFLYYRSMTMATNYAVMEMGQKIQIERLGKMGITGESAKASIAPVRKKDRVLYNPNAGFFSFLIPAILVLIIQQTLLFGVCMLAGQSREDGYAMRLLPPGSSVHRIMQVIIGKALCYFTIYFLLMTYVLVIIPRIFSLPHYGDPMQLLFFMVPFLLSLIFFALTLSVFMRNRETGLVAFLFLSVIFLFASGVSWPQSNINGFWRAFGMLFPSTHGIQGYLKMNTMGSSLNKVAFEYIALWIQAAFYFVTACFAMKPRRIRAQQSKEESTVQQG